MSNASQLISQILNSRLASFAHAAGGVSKLLNITMPVFFEMTTHPDEVLPITIDRRVISIPDLDLDTGYEVFDDQHELLYANAEPEDLYWGTTEEDVQVAFGMTPGAYVYLVYTPPGATEPRTLMLVKL